jgi:AcrR family transcriptional regulator
LNGVNSLEDKKAAIFNCAKKLFSSKGYKDTNVAEITKMAGIATGTFYNYYPSKDQLFIEIYLHENEKLKRSLIESTDLEDDDPVKAFQEFMAQNFKGMSLHPILKEWWNREFFGKLEKEFYEQGGFESIFKQVNHAALKIIQKWKAEGKLRDDLDDELILAILNSLPYIDIHKKEIGIHFFPQIMDYIVEFVMKGLTDCSKNNNGRQ